MKNAAPTQDSDSALNSADYNIPAFPSIMDTVSANVLVFLLNGSKVIGLSDGPVFSVDSTSAAIYELRSKGWPMKREILMALGTDGGNGDFSKYYFPLSVIDLAFRKGAKKWQDGVSASKKKKNGYASNVSARNQGEGQSEN